MRKCAEPTKEGGWGLLQSAAPRVPLVKISKTSPKWISREQARALLAKFPSHTRDMTIFALATGLRRSNVTRLKWAQIDMVRQVAWIVADESKTCEPIAVPLNDEAKAVLHRWERLHKEAGNEWSAAIHAYVFVYRRRAPIRQVTTAMWRRKVKECGPEGTTFHTMRHSWASWHIQGETPVRLLMELGGWKTLDMPLRYTHVNAGHLAAYRDRTLIGVSTQKPAQSTEAEKESHGKRKQVVDPPEVLVPAGRIALYRQSRLVSASADRAEETSMPRIARRLTSQPQPW